MSPEQAAGERGARRAERHLLARAACCTRCSPGEPPFTGPTAQAIIARRFTETPPRAARGAARPCPAASSGRSRRALAKSPADRFASAAEFARALAEGRRAPSGGAAAPRRAGHAPAGRAPTTTQPVRPRPPVPRHAALALGFLLGLGVLFGWLRSHGRADATPAGAKRLAVLPFENLGAAGRRVLRRRRHRRGPRQAGRRCPGSRSSPAAARASTRRPPRRRRRSGASWAWTTCSPARCGGRRRPAASRVRVSPELIQVGDRPRPRGSSRSTPRSPTCSRCRPTSRGGWPQALDVALGAPQKQTLAERPTENLAAYDAFLKGEEAGQGSRSPTRAASGARSTTTSRRWRSTRPSRWPGPSSPGRTLPIYNVGTPTPEAADAARDAAERARGWPRTGRRSSWPWATTSRFVRSDSDRGARGVRGSGSRRRPTTRTC